MPQDSHTVTLTVDCGPHDPDLLVSCLTQVVEMWAEGETYHLVANEHHADRRPDVHATIRVTSSTTANVVDTGRF